jgi:hypothetical protein
MRTNFRRIINLSLINKINLICDSIAMVILFFFLGGMVSGMFIEVKIDDYKDYKIAAYEDILRLEEFDSFYLFERPDGTVWATRDDFCVQVH